MFTLVLLDVFTDGFSKISINYGQNLHFYLVFLSNFRKL
jgi:hypothetical protein